MNTDTAINTLHTAHLVDGEIVGLQRAITLLEDVAKEAFIVGDNALASNLRQLRNTLVSMRKECGSRRDAYVTKRESAYSYLESLPEPEVSAVNA